MKNILKIKNKKYNVLIAPIHFFYTDKYGSELLWAYKIFNKIKAREFINTQGIVFEIIGKNNTDKLIYRGVTDKQYFYSLVDVARFLFFYTRKGLFFGREKKIDILHHILPFSINNTFNPLFFLWGSKIKKVIGPIQASLDYNEKNLSNNTAEDIFGQKKQNFSIYFQKIFSSVFKFLSSRTLKRADRIIVINNVARECLKKENIDERKILVIPPGIDIDKFNYTNFRNKSREILELITVGYLFERKGIELIIKAMREVVCGNKKIILKIVGDGPQRKSLEKLVGELKLKDFVIFEGFIPNEKIQEYYQRAHIFVSMSRSESWGQMYLEAMACGLPIITTKNNGSNEIIKDNEFGYLVEQEDYNTLAEKVLYLSENQDVIRTFGEKARREVEDKYDWDKTIIPKYLDIYNELLKK